MAQSFGYAIVRAIAQSAMGAVGVNPAQPNFIAGSECAVVASFFDSNGNAMVPQALTYQIIEVLTGTVILESAAIPNPLAEQQILVTATQNAMVSNSRASETHELTVSVTDRNNQGPWLAKCRFDITTEVPGCTS